MDKEKLNKLIQFIDKKRIEISLNENDFMYNEEVIDILDDILFEIEKLSQ